MLHVQGPNMFVIIVLEAKKSIQLYAIELSVHLTNTEYFCYHFVHLIDVSQ